MADNDDKTVKQLLDAATRAELERWFGLPSFEQLADQGKVAQVPEDPEVVARRKQIDEALAAVDPRLVAAIEQRAAMRPGVLQFTASVEVQVDPSIARIDLDRVERMVSQVEPREVEIPQQLTDDLHDCTPQALLRDLHRPETMFDKVFEVVDMAAEQRLDIVKLVAEALNTRYHIELTSSPLEEARAELRELRAILRSPWTEIEMPNRGGS